MPEAGRQRPKTASEEKRILYYLRYSDELTMVEIASTFHRELKYITYLAQKHKIKRRKRTAD